MRDLEKLADEIARKIDRAVNDAEQKVKDRWKGRWKAHVHSAGDEMRSAGNSFKRVPDRLSDLATDGSCAMRYLLAYGFKGFAALMMFGGTIAVIMAFAEHPPWNDTQWSRAFLETFSAGLGIIITSQMVWWAGRQIQKSADRKAYARDQNRILRLARDKGGSLTVLEAATDLRLTVEKTEEILRELAIGGHVEMRVSDSGMVIYHFPEIERWDEKHWARPVDEL